MPPYTYINIHSYYQSLQLPHPSQTLHHVPQLHVQFLISHILHEEGTLVRNMLQTYVLSQQGQCEHNNLLYRGLCTTHQPARACTPFNTKYMGTHNTCIKHTNDKNYL